MCRAWLEQAELGYREGYEEGFRERLEQSVILNLFVWRGIGVPEPVRRRLRETEDLAQLRQWRDRAYEITDPEDLFREAPPTTPPPEA